MQEWNEYKNEYSDTAMEYTDSSKEYADPAPEYFEAGTVPKEEGTGKGKSKVRKMAYLVAATVSVTTIGQTLTPQSVDSPQITPAPSQKEQSGYYEYEWPKVPGLDGTYGQGTKTESEEKVTDAELYLSAYESFGYSDGGVVPVKQGGVWGLVDLEGNFLVEPKYESFWMPPNNDGYTIFKNPEGYYITGKDGKEYFYDASVSSLLVGDDGIVKYNLYDEDGGLFHIVYQKLGGDIIYEAAGSELDMELSMANAFQNGKAYITRYVNDGGWSYLVMEELSADGSVREVMNEKKIEEEWRRENNDYQTPMAFFVYGAYDGYSDGYFVGTVPGLAGGIHLVTGTSGEATGMLVFVVIPEYGIGMDHYPNFKQYRNNGCDMLHYKHYGCATVSLEYGGDGKDILFDFFDCQDDDALKTCLACHDEIIFDDFDYMVARDGEEYFYIDLTGKIVSESYVCATPFNENGYALVLDSKQTAYVINANFQVVETMRGVDKIAMEDELLTVRYVEGNEDQKKSGEYGFYYGE